MAYSESQQAITNNLYSIVIKGRRVEEFHIVASLLFKNPRFLIFSNTGKDL